MMGCVTCHTCHASVTDFRPILGNPVEVTHVTSLGHVYVSHTKGLARYFTSFFLQTITSSKHHFLNFFCVSGTHWGLAPSLCSHFPMLHWISLVALPPFATQSMYMSRSAPGCVTRHTRHASVTHFRPISGNIVEVTLVTPPIMYINS